MNKTVLATTTSFLLTFMPGEVIADTYQFSLDGITNWDQVQGSMEGEFSFNEGLEDEAIELSELVSFEISYGDERISLFHDLEHLQNFYFNPELGLLAFRTEKLVDQTREVTIIDLSRDYFLIQLHDTSGLNYDVIAYEAAGYDAPTLIQVKSKGLDNNR